MAYRILLADDSLTIQKVVELTFSEANYELMTVGAGDKAVRVLDEYQPDLVLADVVMPGLSGYEVCEAVKKRPGGEFVPVLLLTGTFEPFDRARAERVGCDGIVTKPFDSHALSSQVGDLIDKAHAARRASPRAQQPTADSVFGALAPPPAMDSDVFAAVAPEPAPAPEPASTADMYATTVLKIPNIQELLEMERQKAESVARAQQKAPAAPEPVVAWSAAAPEPEPEPPAWAAEPVPEPQPEPPVSMETTAPVSAPIEPEPVPEPVSNEATVAIRMPSWEEMSAAAATEARPVEPAAAPQPPEPEPALLDEPPNTEVLPVLPLGELPTPAAAVAPEPEPAPEPVAEEPPAAPAAVEPEPEAEPLSLDLNESFWKSPKNRPAPPPAPTSSGPELELELESEPVAEAAPVHAAAEPEPVPEPVREPEPVPEADEPTLVGETVEDHVAGGSAAAQQTEDPLDVADAEPLAAPIDIAPPVAAPPVAEPSSSVVEEAYQPEEPAPDLPDLATVAFEVPRLPEPEPVATTLDAEVTEPMSLGHMSLAADVPEPSTAVEEEPLSLSEPVPQTAASEDDLFANEPPLPAELEAPVAVVPEELAEEVHAEPVPVLMPEPEPETEVVLDAAPAEAAPEEDLFANEPPAPEAAPETEDVFASSAPPEPRPHRPALGSYGEDEEPVQRDIDEDMDAFERSGGVTARPAELWEQIEAYSQKKKDEKKEPPVEESVAMDVLAAEASRTDIRELISAPLPPIGAPAPSPIPAGPVGLSEGDIDRVARRMVELIGDRIVREVAWDVVPELAERLIRQRLLELERGE